MKVNPRRGFVVKEEITVEPKEVMVVGTNQAA